MATEVPVDDYPARDRHQIQTFILAAVILVTVLSAVISHRHQRAVVQPVRVPAFPHRLLPAGARPAAVHRGDGLLVHPPPGTSRPGAERERGARLGDEHSFASAYAEPASRRLLRHRHQPPSCRSSWCSPCSSSSAGAGPCWRETMMLVPLALYLVIAVGSRTLRAGRLLRLGPAGAAGL